MRASQSYRVFPPDTTPTPLEVGLEKGGELTGVCAICGEAATFSFSGRIRESGICSVCKGSNRKRQIAHIIRHHWGSLTLPPGMGVLNTEARGALHDALQHNEEYVASEYYGASIAPGAVIKGRRHENLCALSFRDSTLDLVISSDVLEHIPDPYMAHQEVFRVLKPGGRHIFTVPFNNGLYDQVRARIRADGSIEHIEKPAYHGDPLQKDGILVFVVFGFEMLYKLNSIGYKTRMWNLHEPAHGIVGVAQVFEAIKPA